MSAGIFISASKRVGRESYWLIFGLIFDVGGSKAGLFFAEWIDEIGDEIFFFGLFLEDFFFIFNDDFVIGNFDDFFAVNGEFWVDNF